MIGFNQGKARTPYTVELKSYSIAGDAEIEKLLDVAVAVK